MKRLTAPLFLLMLVAGCMKPEPVDFNGHSVKIRTATPQDADKQAAAVEARNICGKVGKRAEYASTSYIHDLNYRHLFLCI